MGDGETGAGWEDGRTGGRCCVCVCVCVCAIVRESVWVFTLIVRK